jgi:taurine dioxygenase
MSTSLIERTDSDNSSFELHLVPQTSRIGAEVKDIDLSRPLEPAVLHAVRNALLRWRVLFFRGQDVGHGEHVSLANQLGGALYTHPFEDGEAPITYPTQNRVQGHPELYRVDHRWFQAKRAEGATTSSYANSFRGVHVDSGALVNPPSVSILRADVVPEFGGDTTWFDSVSAYTGLSGPVRDFVHELWAVHEYGAEFDAYRDASFSEHKFSQHPVVRVIPETGERSLFVTPVFTKRIVGLSQDESQWVLDFLYGQLTRPGYSVRFRWEPGDVAISDNRTTTHIGPQDLSPDVDRILLLTEIEGSPAISTDGRASLSIEGTPRRRSKTADPLRPHFL